jgi:Glucose-6-phosphate dehydrogenase, C-terminal domain/Glucose-6-phosphate dehydrogenase, NAD binding domain
MPEPHSDALVLFGATGDLAYKQIFPALYAMTRRGHLNMPVIGVAKSRWTIEQLRARARENIAAHGDMDPRRSDGSRSDFITSPVTIKTPPRSMPCAANWGRPNVRCSIWRSRPACSPSSCPKSRGRGVPQMPVSLWKSHSVVTSRRQRHPNQLCFALSPDVFMALTARAKVPGEAMVGEDVRLVEHRCLGDEMEPYERLLGDAMSGDRTLFGGQAGVEAAWRVVDAVLRNGEPVFGYDCGSCGPAEAESLAADAGGWLEPSVAARLREPERGANEKRVAGWLETAAAVPGFTGFAVGRTTFWDAVVDYEARKASREEATSRVADRYRRWAAIFDRVRASSASAA